MNNKERLAWLLSLVIVVLFADRKLAQIERLETLDKHRQVSAEIQRDQFLELSQNMNEIISNKHKEGFELGKTQALVASLNKENVLDYSEGYHAALSQFNFDENANHLNSNKDTYELIVKLLDANNQSLDNYKDLLDMFSENAN